MSPAMKRAGGGQSGFGGALHEFAAAISGAYRRACSGRDGMMRRWRNGRARVEKGHALRDQTPASLDLNAYTVDGAMRVQSRCAGVIREERWTSLYRQADRLPGQSLACFRQTQGVLWSSSPVRL
jgi:hypothetical protein